ncbi:MAG: hypothetical protein Q8L48_20105 [Archangium sp.]|nr:hypothetical protein [Archangium sp.]
MDELLELERQWARLSADGRGEGPSPPALTVLRVSGFALCVGCLVALCGNLRDTGPRVLLGAALVTAIAALWGFLHER